MTTLNTQIRKLRSDQLAEIAKILNQDDCWKKLMAVVPNDENKPLFKPEHVSMIEQSTQMEQRIAAEVFLTEWSTMGKRRPTCRTLLDLLVETKLFRAADYLAVEILKIDPPERPKIGPAAPVDVSDSLVETLLKQRLNNTLKKAESNAAERARSMRLQEKPVGAPTNAEAANKSDPIKSDLIKISKTATKTLEQKPKDISDLIKFSSEEVSASNFQTEDFALPEAQSGNIPLCVRAEDMFENVTITNSSANENSATDTAITFSDISRTAEGECSSELDLPQVSERFIPVVVLEYTDDQSGSK